MVSHTDFFFVSRYIHLIVGVYIDKDKIFEVAYFHYFD